MSEIIRHKGLMRCAACGGLGYIHGAATTLVYECQECQGVGTVWVGK